MTSRRRVHDRYRRSGLHRERYQCRHGINPQARPDDEQHVTSLHGTYGSLQVGNVKRLAETHRRDLQEPRALGIPDMFSTMRVGLAEAHAGERFARRNPVATAETERLVHRPVKLDDEIGGMADDPM